MLIELEIKSFTVKRHEMQIKNKRRSEKPCDVKLEFKILIRICDFKNKFPTSIH